MDGGSGGGDGAGRMSGTGWEGVTVVRDGTTVLRDVTLHAGDGELLVVLGASGSGKSTLLRVLAGLDQLHSGDVVIRDRTVTGVPPDRRRVSMVFETSALIPFLDVSANLGWGLRTRGLSEPDVEERVAGRARSLRLERFLSRLPSALSGGERGLAGLGRALVQTPDVFLFDEPLAGLDPGQRSTVRRQIVDLVRRLGVPTIYVTHDQEEGLAVADRVALLHSGALVQVGRPRELYDRPGNLLAAGFVGTPSIGLLPARLVSAGGQAGFVVGPRTLPLWRPVPAPLRGHVGREVVLGLRAEDVRDAADGADPESVALDALVTDAEFTGRHTVVTLAVGAPPVTAPGVELSGGGPSGATLRSLLPARTPIGPGDLLRVAVRASDAHVFVAVTGSALWHPADAPT